MVFVGYGTKKASLYKFPLIPIHLDGMSEQSFTFSLESTPRLR
jgi:hypothetical protein